MIWRYVSRPQQPGPMWILYENSANVGALGRSREVKRNYILEINKSKIILYAEQTRYNYRMILHTPLTLLIQCCTCCIVTTMKLSLYNLLSKEKKTIAGRAFIFLSLVLLWLQIKPYHTIEQFSFVLVLGHQNRLCER